MRASEAQAAEATAKAKASRPAAEVEDATNADTRHCTKRLASMGIRAKIALIIGAVMLVVLAADSLWNVWLQQRQAENEVLEKAQVLATEMRATWDFVDYNQESLNRNPDGTFRTKNLVCVVSAKAVSQLFTDNSDYRINFVKENPRQVSATPDTFEQEAFDAFRADPDLEAYWGIVTDEDGNQVFRYIEPLYVTESCLECHGDPVGELDQFGYPKEGLRLGDIGGAMSITEPMAIYNEARDQVIYQQVLITLLVLMILSVTIYTAVSVLVLRPLDQLRESVHAVDTGDFSRKIQPDLRYGRSEITDLTQDFNSMSDQLQALYQNLEGEVSKKTEEMRILNDMLLYQQRELKHYIDRLSEETAYKNEFFAITSHELRTPLTSILGYARMLLDSDSLDEKSRSHISEIEHSATNLLDMVNNLLVLSRAEAKKNQLVCEAVDFVDLLGTVKAALTPMAKDKRITLTSKVDAEVPLLNADWEKLRRILENLTSNAIKYTHPEGHVELRAKFDPDGSMADVLAKTRVGTGAAAAGGELRGQAGTAGDELRGQAGAAGDELRGQADAAADEDDGQGRFDTGSIILEVEDDGVGIAPEDQGAIFEKYAQSIRQSSNRRFKGTGLGLAVVKELAELHGGFVAVESQPHRGSTFRVVLPYVAFDEDGLEE